MSADRVTWAGHSTVLLEMGGARVLTDPVLRARVAHLRRHGEVPSGELVERLDAVLISHLHYDHLDVPSLRGIAGDVRAFGPHGAGALLARAGFDDRGGAPSRRRGRGGRGARGRRTGRARSAAPAARAAGGSARLRAGGRLRVYFAGDTDLFDGMSEIGPVDLALLPVAGWGPELGNGGHLDPESAARAAALIRPKVAVPIHWGTLHPRGRRLGDWFTEPGRRFAAHAAELAPEVDVRVLAPGESLAL